MDIRTGDIVEMKKNHPCAPDAKRFLVLRVGMDFKIRCEKNIRTVTRPSET